MLCTDLDRTLIPNGAQPESPFARELFRRLVSREEFTLAYASGRHFALIKQAIADFKLPQPDFIIADVGSSIYRVDLAGWRQLHEWDEQIASDWRGLTHDDICRLLSIFPELRLQESEKQNLHKLSFYIPLETGTKELVADIEDQLKQVGIMANMIWSIDQVSGVGLIDILPASASKLHAICFLMQQEGFSHENTIFAGDSGNDLNVLLSDIPAVLPANAEDEVRSMVAGANKDSLYVACGGYLGMNGNYSAGILEGVAHYWPEADAWLRDSN